MKNTGCVKKNHNGIVLLLVMVITCTMFLAGSMTASAKDKISLKEAKKIALADAGKKASSVKFLEAKLDDGLEYEIEFQHKKIVYKYDIDAAAGRITYRSRTTIANYRSGKKIITASKARSIARKKLTGSSGKVVYMKTEVTVENKKLVYEIEFLKGNKVYSCDVDAYSKKVRDIEKVKLNNYSKNKSLIGKRKALEIALKAAGMEKSDLDHMKIELCEDDHYLVYEVVLEKNGREYEYQIDAYTGKIRDIDID